MKMNFLSTFVHTAIGFFLLLILRDDDVRVCSAQSTTSTPSSCGQNEYFNTMTQRCMCYSDNINGFWETFGPHHECSVCMLGYRGTNCTIKCPCSGHGSCNEYDVCSCLDNWTGVNCGECKPGIVGIGCNVSCADINCHGHGTCVLVNHRALCECDSSDDLGFYAGEECTVCSAGYSLDNDCKVEEESTNNVVVVGILIILVVMFCVVAIYIPVRAHLDGRRQRRRHQQMIDAHRAQMDGDEHAPDAPPPPPPPMESVSREMQEYEQDLDTVLAPSRAVRELLESHGETIPREFVCPITNELFVDPVVTSDGQTYERTAILQWFKKKKTSPVTNLSVDTNILVSNNAIKSQVHIFREKVLGLDNRGASHDPFADPYATSTVDDDPQSSATVAMTATNTNPTTSNNNNNNDSFNNTTATSINNNNNMQAAASEETSEG
eukprot:PhM_4_TR10915/c0_g1_i1/m.5904